MALSISVLAVGKLKHAGLSTACNDYVRMTRPFFAVEVQSVRDLDALRARAKRLARPVVVLDELGDEITTRELAQWLGDWRDGGIREVSFLIGGSDGFSDEDRSAADRVLALSRLTLAHRVARVVLLEQIYRAATLLAGHPYHRG